MGENNKRFYCNSVQANATLYDIELALFDKGLGEVYDSEGYLDVNKPSSELLATIKMSWPHAKAFYSLLKDQIEQYEDSFGTILLEPNKK